MKNEIVQIMIKGADLGITGEGRWPSIGKNSPSTEEFGERLVDALQASIILGHMCGPLTEEEVRSLGDIKIAPMDVRPKPNGGVRIIIDMSFPRYKTWEEDGKWRTVQLGDGKVLSPNAGMEMWKEIEECTMSTDRHSTIVGEMQGCQKMIGHMHTSMSQYGERIGECRC